MRKLTVIVMAILGLTLAETRGLAESIVPNATPLPYGVYLPVVMRGYAYDTPTLTATPLPSFTPTATPTLTQIPTATATTISCNGFAQVFDNTDFNSGLDYWTVLSGSPSIYSLFNLRFLLLGKVSNTTDMVGQAAIVPVWAETAALYFKYYMESLEDVGDPAVDYFWAAIVDENNTPIASRELSNATAKRQKYQMIRVPIDDISAYRGSAIGAVLAATNNWGYATKWYIDWAELWFGCGPEPASEARK